MRFSPDYVRLVLNDNFEDAKAQFIAPLMAIHYAHLIMLREEGIVSVEDANAIRQALDTIAIEDVRATQYDGTYEDLFFFLERKIKESCGEDAAGRLHTARSRNDIDMTMYRMQQRTLLLDIVAGVLSLRRVLLALASRHHEDVYPAHTHTQPAQPSTLAHYLLAIVEQLERDTVRLEAAYRSTNLNPLGACAITGTGFSIDRGRTSQLLGFDAPTCNTYGSIATIDYTLEGVGAAAVLLAGVGRVVQDLLLWCTTEFGYLRLPDGFVQGSSIMPQKRNPVALEHARAIGSKALGQAMGIFLAVHNTPFGDIVDTEDDLQPLVTRMLVDATRAVSLVAAALEHAEFNVAKMAQRAGENWITITELADTLARDHGMPFRAAHGIAAQLIAASSATPNRPRADILREVSAQVTGTAIAYTPSELDELLSPKHFVAMRRTYGGPAPEETIRGRGVSDDRLRTDEAWLHTTREQLAVAAAALKEAAEIL